MLGPPGAGSLGRRLSGNFSRKSSISANDNAGVNRKNSLATGSLLRRGSKTSSVSSAESGGSDPRESGDCLGRANGAVGGISRSADLEDVPEVDDAAHYSPRSPRSDKGKGRAMDSSVNANGQYGSSWSSRHPDAPLRDPFDETSSDDFRSSPTLRNNKPTPTARHPIVTPGRAPSISRRSSAPLSTRGSMPSIVATDADAGANADLRNPFRSDEGEKGGAATSRTGSGGYSMNSGRRYGRESSGLRDVEEGDERESNTSPIGNSRSGDDVEARPRKSTSSSRFQEIGIDGEGDAEAEEEKERADRERRRRGNKEEETPRKAWWTDWLCGCGAEPDDDEQVSLASLTLLAPFPLPSRPFLNHLTLPCLLLSCNPRPAVRTRWNRFLRTKNQEPRQHSRFPRRPPHTTLPNLIAFDPSPTCQVLTSHTSHILTSHISISISHLTSISFHYIIYPITRHPIIPSSQHFIIPPSVLGHAQIIHHSQFPTPHFPLSASPPPSSFFSHSRLRARMRRI